MGEVMNINKTTLNKPMKVLVACEYSGIVRDAFTIKGHDAWSCDILPTDNPNGNHYEGDVKDILYNDWDLIIAHPPCTYFANSGVRWLYEKPNRWAELDKSAEFFNLFLDHPCEKVAIENPVIHKHALKLINNRKYTQTIQPWQFGHGETKRTCLWLKGLPKLQPTNIVEGREQRVWKLAPSKDRWKLRSTTFQGIANAMADQWG